MDGIFLIFPPLLTFTLLSDFVFPITILLILLFILLFFSIASFDKADWKSFLRVSLYSTSNKFFLTNFRSYINALSCISILAVDFSIFPVRFHKSELFGVGLMDIGVGSYIGMSALVSPCVLRPVEFRGRPISQRLVETLWSCSLILLVGVGRLMLLWLFSYHQPVTEYGVHWNFFLTIAVVRLVAFCVTSLVPSRLYPTLFIWTLPIILLYQWDLNHGLILYIQNGRFGPCDNCSDTRDGFINANREGILSSIGFSWIYLASISVGYLIHYGFSNSFQAVKKLGLLSILALLLWVATWLSQEFVQPISRCAANLSYCLWTLATQLSFLAIFLLVDLLTAFLLHSPLLRKQLSTKNADISKILNKLQPLVLRAINRFQLLYFLSSNLLTGLVNVLIRDEPVWKSVAFLILSIYQLVLIAAAVSMENRYYTET